MKKTILLLALSMILTTQTLFAQVPSYVPTNGLVGYWPFNGNANDESGNGNNGQLFGPLRTSDRFNSSGSALLFDGIDDGVILPGNVLPYSAGSYSISFWCKLNIDITHADSWTIFDDRDNLGWNSKGRFIVGIGNSNDSWYQMSDAGPQAHYAFTPSVWTNFVCVYDNLNNQMLLYKEGIFATSIPCSNNWYLSGNRPLNIGRGESPIQYKPNSNYVEHWQGVIDDIGIWNRALTQQEITNLYNSANTNECLTMTIKTGVLSTIPVTYTSSVNIYPNPANDQITIDCGNIAKVTGWSIKITNALGQEVFNKPMNVPQYTVPLNTWSGQGMYFVKIINAQNEVVNIKKIILQ